MSQLPDPIKTEFNDSEGGIHQRSEQAILFDLVEGFNQLVTYLDSISERL